MKPRWTDADIATLRAHYAEQVARAEAAEAALAQLKAERDEIAGILAGEGFLVWPTLPEAIRALAARADWQTRIAAEHAWFPPDWATRGPTTGE